MALSPPVIDLAGELHGGEWRLVGDAAKSGTRCGGTAHHGAGPGGALGGGLA